MIVPKAGNDFGASAGSGASIYERSSGTDTKKADVPALFASQSVGPANCSGLGWTFEPGTQVILKVFGGTTTIDANWSIFGYLTTL